MVTDYLKASDISFDLYEHEPVFTVDQAKIHTGHLPGMHCKNLFLRNRNGKKHYLLVLQEDTNVNLKAFSEEIGSTNLSFASSERLYEYLKLRPGSVGPFGLLNDTSRHVEVYFDSVVYESEYSAFHPNINNQTVVLKTKDLIKLLEDLGYQVKIL